VRDLEKIKAMIRQAYPAVPQLSTDTLAQWMQERARGPLLVDVRLPEEFAVSHLRGAVNLQGTAPIAATVRDLKPSQTILYCSVGFRSTRLAHLLTRQGVPGVFNLEGSIFQWVNEGRIVYQGERPVDHVHPYTNRWAGLLREGSRWKGASP
jgi:rhodanese-related sulfurtransferase